MAQYRAETFTIFGSYVGRNDDFINSFGNLLTFNMKLTIMCGWFSKPNVLCQIMQKRFHGSVHSMSTNLLWYVKVNRIHI